MTPNLRHELGEGPMCLTAEGLKHELIPREGKVLGFESPVRLFRHSVHAIRGRVVKIPSKHRALSPLN